MTSLLCLQELIVPHVGAPRRDGHTVHEGSRLVTNGFKQVLHHMLKRRIPIHDTHGHDLPLNRAQRGAHGYASTGLICHMHLVNTMFQVNHLEDPPPELLLQHVLAKGSV